MVECHVSLQSNLILLLRMLFSFVCQMLADLSLDWPLNVCTNDINRFIDLTLCGCFSLFSLHGYPQNCFSGVTLICQHGCTYIIPVCQSTKQYVQSKKSEFILQFFNSNAFLAFILLLCTIIGYPNTKENVQQYKLIKPCI